MHHAPSTARLVHLMGLMTYTHRRLQVTLGIVGLLLVCRGAWAQRLESYLSPDARRCIQASGCQGEVCKALGRLEKSEIPQATLRELLQSDKAAPYLPGALGRMADLSGVGGLADLAHRFASNGQGGAYEIAVAHAHKGLVQSVSSFINGNETDGRLRSGTIIESKSAEPRRPDHLIEQLRKRAEGGQRVLLAVNYMPNAELMGKLRQLSGELGGRLGVNLIPLSGSSFQILIPGDGVERPTCRTPSLDVSATLAAQSRSLPVWLGRHGLAPGPNPYRSSLASSAAGGALQQAFAPRRALKLAKPHPRCE